MQASRPSRASDASARWPDYVPGMPPAGNRRGKYLGFVAHEIKNPLATALWSCDLLKRMGAADRAGPRAEKMVDASLRALRRMRRLVDDYFTIERLQERGYELHSEHIELRGLVELRLLIRAVFFARGLTVWPRAAQAASRNAPDTGTGRSRPAARQDRVGRTGAARC